MAKAGLETHLAFMKKGPNLELIERSHVIIHELPRRSQYDPRMLSDLRKVVSRVRPHIIQTWLTQMDILAGSVAWTKGIPLILSERSSGMAYPHSARNWLRGIIGRRAAAVVSNSYQGCEYWRRLRFKGKMALIRNGIPFEQIRKAEPCYRWPIGAEGLVFKSGKVILFAGSFIEQKNPEKLMEAFSLVLKRYDAAIAILFGQGAMLSRMEQLRSTLTHKERIHICGYTDKLWGYMRAANVLVSLSLFEGNPNVVLEGIAAQCPLVLSDIPEHREIVDDESAILVDPRDVEAVAKAILTALENPEYASGLAQRAYSRIASWSVDSAADQYRALYASIVYGLAGRV
jgi:glycosyltransferase involved in cell wall biosynthesis